MNEGFDSEMDEIIGVGRGHAEQEKFKRQVFYVEEAKASSALTADENGNNTGSMDMVYLMRAGEPYENGGVSENEAIFLVPDTYWAALTIATSVLHAVFGQATAQRIFNPIAMRILKERADEIDAKRDAQDGNDAGSSGPDRQD